MILQEKAPVSTSKANAKSYDSWIKSQCNKYWSSSHVAKYIIVGKYMQHNTGLSFGMVASLPRLPRKLERSSCPQPVPEGAGFQRSPEYTQRQPRDYLAEGRKLQRTADEQKQTGKGRTKHLCKAKGGQ
jgi:hypothetical protein